MKQLRDYSDDRHKIFCAYCGNATETRDHVPPKVFLDKPYPSNLPIVGACQKCNQNFSLDEEYVACFVECTSIGSANFDDIKREKVREILKLKPALGTKLAEQIKSFDLGKTGNVGMERTRRISLKLARGHAAFELGEPLLNDSSLLSIGLLATMDQEERNAFEKPPESPFLPETGSRLLQKLVEQGKTEWIIVQPERYRYHISDFGGTIVVRIVLSEYLTIGAAWNLD